MSKREQIRLLETEINRLREDLTNSRVEYKELVDVYERQSRELRERCMVQNALIKAMEKAVPRKEALKHMPIEELIEICSSLNITIYETENKADIIKNILEVEKELEEL